MSIATVVADSVALVVPCCNEQHRLNRSEIDALADGAAVMVILVDDGSTDATLPLLRSIAASRAGGSVEVLALERNVGKGEAVRAGMRAALRSNPVWVGYLDADFATPATEMLRLIDVARSSSTVNAVLGSRVAMLGRQITRTPFRHYTGRVFATVASNVLGLVVYDTQCGAKLFRAGHVLDRALAEPFRSRWAFDVELLGRLIRHGFAATTFREEPLEIWHDRPGSKRSVRSSLHATATLWTVRRNLRRE